MMLLDWKMKEDYSKLKERAAERVLRKIHDCTFRPKDFLPDFFDLNSPKNFNFQS